MISAPALAGCYVISLRPVGEHAPMRRAAARHGARVLALSPFKLAPRDDAHTRRQLRAALARASRIIVTSPAAARAARALQPLRPRRGQHWYAVGAGTAAALRRAGIDGVAMPTRMDSEGLLALPGLQAVRGAHIAVLTAPGGRNLIGPALQARGAQVLRVEVYARATLPPRPRAIAALRALPARPWLMLSSAEAMAHVLATLPADAAAVLLRARVSAASARLAELAHAWGFTDIVVAGDARPRALLDAAAAHARPRRR